jgi:uncharacterized membrane protein
MDFCLIVGSFREIKNEACAFHFSVSFLLAKSFSKAQEAIIMATELKSIYGIYEDWTDARKAVDELHDLGFSDREVSLLVHAENVHKDALAPEKHTKSVHGLAIGAASGAVVGGGLGLLAGLGALVIPGIGPMIAFGPILTALSGAGMGIAAGSVAGSLAGAGIPRHRVDKVQGMIEQGGILVAVHVEDLELKKQVYRTLERNGAKSISTSAQENISSIDDISPSFMETPSLPKEDFISRKQF